LIFFVKNVHIFTFYAFKYKYVFIIKGKSMFDYADFIEIGIVDLNGRLKTRTLMNKDIEKVLKKGIGFDGSSVDLADIEDSDLVAIPDPSTMKIYTCNGHRIAFFLCDVYKDDEPLSYYPRYVLKKVLRDNNLEMKVGPEIEFYVKKARVIGNHEYMNPYPLDDIKPLKRKLMKNLENMGFDVKLEHHEVGDGQHEITIGHKKAVEMADSIIFYKHYLRSFFIECGKDITFMPKPFYGLNGNGMHLHITLHDGSDKNLFTDGSELTDEAKSFIAGILSYAREITLATNQTVNSFKRLVPGFEAPIYLSWGYGNRSALIRVPKYRKNRINRIEVRMPDPLCNPYLAIAAIFLAGVDGIRRNMSPPDPISENIYKIGEEMEMLPSNLGDVIKEAEKGTILRDIMNEGFKRLIDLKKKEWNSYLEYLRENNLSEDMIEVTEWEIRKYFYA